MSQGYQLFRSRHCVSRCISRRFIDDNVLRFASCNLCSRAARSTRPGHLLPPIPPTRRLFRRFRRCRIRLGNWRSQKWKRHRDRYEDSHICPAFACPLTRFSLVVDVPFPPPSQIGQAATTPTDACFGRWCCGVCCPLWHRVFRISNLMLMRIFWHFFRFLWCK